MNNNLVPPNNFDTIIYKNKANSLIKKLTSKLFNNYNTKICENYDVFYYNILLIYKIL